MGDPIFLLSIEEYRKYQDSIPPINCVWWLQSPGFNNYKTAFVYLDGCVYYFGNNVYNDYFGIRPALRLDTDSLSLQIVDESTIWHLGITWKKIDDNLYISEMPIAFRRFDEDSNEYETSEVRKFLLDWYEERKKKR